MNKIDSNQIIPRAIEEYFPIVEINRLAVPERNAFKPIYQMHKWFARRASCVFRAILLGALKPAGTDIMEEFYKDHTHDQDTNGKVILDPFMGGGTTVVEALRLGCKVIGIDLNPVAWFIVKTEVESVDLDELKAAFERLAERMVGWSGKTLRETLLDQYKTQCPCCEPNGDGVRNAADIIYTFWVKSAICTNPLCRKEVPLFSDYIVCQKSPSIRYHQDVNCPKCKKTFDWEVETASLVAEKRLMIRGAGSAGIGRSNKRWTFSSEPLVVCPWCEEAVEPKPRNFGEEKRKNKLQRKKVPLHILHCPSCSEIFQVRGNLEETVTCPTCQKAYNPYQGNVLEKGKFLCPSCGTKDLIINSIRRMPQDQLLPLHAYALEGYCPICGGDGEPEEGEEDSQENLFSRHGGRTLNKLPKDVQPDHVCMIKKNNGKFFKRISAADVARYQQACSHWEKEKDGLPYPKQEIAEGQETHRLLERRYRYWHQMFNPRQLLCLSTLLKSIDEEADQTLKEMLLTAFYQLLRNQNLFCFYNTGANKLEPLFSRHDFAPVSTCLENNVWGKKYGRGTFDSVIDKVIEGKRYAFEPYDVGQEEAKHGFFRDPLNGSSDLRSNSSTQISCKPQLVDYVITDPPYGGNVNYSELSDFFYVWLKQILDKRYSEFYPEYTPKTEEIIVNPSRQKTAEDFQGGLTQVFRECYRVMRDDGLMAFTFHHTEGETWQSVLSALCEAGFEIESVYPVHGDEFKGEGMGAMAISYDLIHVCRKRTPDASVNNRSWAGIRQEIRKKAREEIQKIEAGRYGKELSPGDVNMVLIGKCLELYSRHYGAVINHEGNPVPLRQALEEIKMFVDQLVTKEKPLPGELADIDPESYVYLVSLCEKKEIKSDEVHKATRGGILEIDDLIKAGLLIKGRTKGGRTYEVKTPMERFSTLAEKFSSGTEEVQKNLFGEAIIPPSKKREYFIDKVHFLMGLAEAKESLLPWIERWRGESREIRAACAYISAKKNEYAPVLGKILKMMESGPLFR